MKYRQIHVEFLGLFYIRGKLNDHSLDDICMKDSVCEIKGKKRFLKNVLVDDLVIDDGG